MARSSIPISREAYRRSRRSARCSWPARPRSDAGVTDPATGTPRPSSETVTGPGADADAPPTADAKKVTAHRLARARSSARWSGRRRIPRRPTDERTRRVRARLLPQRRERRDQSRGTTKKKNCPEGWYELAEGGFVCGQFVTDDPNHPELANGKGLHPPLTDGPLPYKYGLNLTNGAPLYRRVPTKKERARDREGPPRRQDARRRSRAKQQRAAIATTAPSPGTCRITRGSARR